MKKIFSFLVTLILLICSQTFSNANDIGEFDIDGISIGESFLKYIGKNILEEKYKAFYPGSKEYYLVEFISVNYSLKY